MTAINLLSACGGSGGSTDSTVIDPPVAKPVIGVAGSTVTEGDSGSSSLVFAVTMDKPASGDVSVNYKTNDGTATAADNDYLPVDDVLTIVTGLTTAEVAITVWGDLNAENNESFTLALSNPTSNVAIGQSSATGTILDDESVSELVDIPRGLLSHGNKGRALDQAIIDHDNVSGFLVLDGWDDIEVTEGVFDWSHIDSEVARAKAVGKVVRLAIHAGGDSAPQWIFTNYPDVKQVIWYDKVSGDIEWLPAYWDPVYIEIKRRFYEAIGTRYANEPAVFAVSASMVDPNTGDWAFRAGTDEQIQSYLDAGFTEERFIAAYKTVLDYGMAAFQNKRVVTAVGPVPLTLVSDKFFAVHEVLDYAYATYGDRLIIAKGALHAATPDPATAPSDSQWQTISKYSPNVAGQFVWSVSGDPDFKMNGGTPYDSSEAAVIFRRAAENGKRYGMRWIEPWNVDFLNPDLQDEIANAALLLQSD